MSPSDIRPQAMEQIREVLNNYARGCDERNWALFERVFVEDVAFNYGGEYDATGRHKLVKLIQNSLGGCGPTQHLLGNFSIEVNGDSANCHCYVRAFHVGRGSKRGQLYEVWGEYRDRLQYREGAWKIVERYFAITSEHGSRDVLAPTPPQ